MRNVSVIAWGVCLIFIPTLLWAEAIRPINIQFIILQNKKEFRLPFSEKSFYARQVMIKDMDGVREFDYYADSFTSSVSLSFVQMVEIVVEDNSLARKKLSWDYMELVRLAEFFRRDSILEELDCGRFIHILKGIEYRSEALAENGWREIPINENSHIFDAGDVVGISKVKDCGSIFHFSVYLGDDMHLSKFGKSNKLFVTDIREMKSFFDGTCVFLLQRCY